MKGPRNISEKNEEVCGRDKTKTLDMNIDLNLQCNSSINLLPMNRNCDTFLSSLLLLLAHVCRTTFTGHEGYTPLKWSS